MNRGICWAFATFLLFFSLISTALSVNESSNSSAINLTNESFSTSLDDIYVWLKDNSEVLQSLAVLAGLLLYIKRSWLMHLFKHNHVPEKNLNSENFIDNSESDIKIPEGLFRVALRPTASFTGRERFLKVLHESAIQKTDHPKIFALVGNGGMGKTQIALQHAHNPENNFKYVWWLRSEEPATLLEDYISIARDLHLPGWDLRDTDQTVKTVKLWLEGQCDSRWLLVFDNAKERKDLERYVPVAGNGQIIVTSRLSVWDGFAQLMEVGVFQRDKLEGESVDFLLKRTGKDDRKGAADLAAELGDLPLALEQAGAYIKESGISLSDYIARLKENRKDILRQGKPRNYPDSVATTWEISFQAVQNELPAAGDLLNLCAFLAPDAIPRWLLEGEAEHLPGSLALCVGNAGEFDHCIAILKKYSLISAADNLFSIHRLVQAVIQDRLSIEEQKIWAESALKIVNDAFSFNQYDQKTWEKCSEISSHAFYVSEHAQKHEASLQETAHLLAALGAYLENRMELAYARSVLERALVIGEKVLGTEHTLVASIVSVLGKVLMDQGDLEEARRCRERALAIDEKALGPEHTNVARNLNNLGSVLEAQGDLEGAKKCYQRALAIEEKALGPESINVVGTLNNLGVVLKAQGDVDEAKKCCERALAISEKAFRPDNIHIAICLNNLGVVLQDKGDLEGAKKCYQRALAIDEKALGIEHTSVAIDVNNLGSVLDDLGDQEGAKKCYERALGIFEMRLGKDHPNSVLVRNNLRKLQK